MKNSIILFSATFLFVSLGLAQPNKLPIDASHSVVTFSVGFAGDLTNIEGRFNEFEGEVGYSKPGDRSSYFASIKINVNSINTGDSERDEDLKGAEFFDSATYPEITFKSTSTIKTSDGFLLNGILEMVGVSKEIEIPFQFSHTTDVAWVFGEPRIAAKGEITLSRAEFKIPKRGWNSVIPSLGSMMLNDNVEIRLVIQGVGMGLTGILMQEIETNGVNSAIKRYKQMKKENEGKETYSFGASTLARVGMSLSRAGNNADGIKVAEFAIKEESTNFFGFYALGTIYKADGNKDAAIKNFEKVLELNPNFDRAKKQLDELNSN